MKRRAAIVVSVALLAALASGCGWRGSRKRFRTVLRHPDAVGYRQDGGCRKQAEAARSTATPSGGPTAYCGMNCSNGREREGHGHLMTRWNRFGQREGGDGYVFETLLLAGEKAEHTEIKSVIYHGNERAIGEASGYRVSAGRKAHVAPPAQARPRWRAGALAPWRSIHNHPGEPS